MRIKEGDSRDSGPGCAGRSPSLGHCITMQGTMPAHPVLHSSLRHCRLAAWHSSLVAGAAPSQNRHAALWAKQSKVSGRFSKAAVSGPASQSSPPAGTRMWPQQIAFAHWRLLGACLQAASPSSLNLDKVLWRKRNVWCALVFPVIVPRLALLVRFSKISCRWIIAAHWGLKHVGSVSAL